MSSGGWPASGPRHGRHRRESVNEAWTPAVRPGEAAHQPVHARLDGAPPSLLARQPGWPVPRPPADEPRLLDDPLLAPWREQLAGLDDPWPAGPAEVARDPLDLPPPPPPAVVASLLAEPGSRPRDDDTMPLALVPLPREEPDVHLPGHSLETPPRGLRKFDLGTVPASVTPPRTWRKAAWFAVGTSAAVVCGLAIAAVRLVGAPSPGYTIDALPAYPTKPMEIEQLPAQETSEAPATSGSRGPEPSSADRRPDRPLTDSARNSEDVAIAGSSAVEQTTGSPEEPGTSTASTGNGEPTEPTRPSRTTVGPEPVTPTDPQRMGDRTEQFYALVTEDPQAAHELCTGGMARQGPEGIEARYAGVERVEVQEITIDRNRGVTTSKVKVVHKDGRETIEERRLTFTWGGDPKISDETISG